MLLNLEYFRQYNISQKLLEMANEKMYRILEQDILNKFFKENITYIEDCWNFPTMNPIYKQLMKNIKDLSIQKRYDTTRDNPAIIHWAGRGKAWNNPQEDLAYKWWEYARRTPFYETILLRIYTNPARELPNQIKHAFNYKKNCLTYWRYKFLYAISFGKTKEHYRTKKTLWKEKIKIGKILKK